MKTVLKILTLLSLVMTSAAFSNATSIFNQEKLSLIKGGELGEKDLNGKVVVLTNIATECGYTGQLDDLEALYQKYKDKGLVVIGVPSNDFGGQTPQENQEVAKFCKLNYGVTFPLAKKQVVSGKGKTNLITKLLAADQSKVGEIKWNFEKFIIDRAGQLVGRFRSDVKPLSKDMTKLIESKL